MEPLKRAQFCWYCRQASHSALSCQVSPPVEEVGRMLSRFLFPFLSLLFPLSSLSSLFSFLSFLFPLFSLSSLFSFSFHLFSSSLSSASIVIPEKDGTGFCFEVTHFFAFGSPLGLVLASRRSKAKRASGGTCICMRVHVYR